MPDKWAQYAQPASGDKWAKYAQPQTANAAPKPQQGSIRAGDSTPLYSNLGEDKLTRIEHGYPGESMGHEAARFVGNIGAGGLGVALHPIDTLKGIGSTIAHPDQAAHSLYESLNTEPGETIAPMIGQGAVAGGVGEATGAALKPIGSAIRSAAIGNPDVAALKGLRVPPSSPKTLSTLKAVEGARPYLQGAKSLEDLQAKIPGAKSEIWGPYQKTVDAIGDKSVRGPDGPTNVRALEEERQQLSALNRGLKQQNPESIQLAQQKGMTQAQLLDREKAVQAALDPHLEAAGVDPKAIRQTFGQVAQVGSRVSGKATIAETPQPYGFAKLGDLSLTKPLSNFGTLGGAARDVAAGRYWSAKPTDVAIREGFGTGGPKPDFRAPSTSMPPFEYPPKQLPASTIGNGQHSMGGGPTTLEPTPGQSGLPHPGPSITPAPIQPKALPPTASPGTPQPMFRYAKPYVEPFDPQFTPVDLDEYAKQAAAMKGRVAQ